MPLLALAIILPGTPADAGFPGSNGRIVFSSYDGNHRRIFTMGPRGGGLTQILASGGDPQWSPDGTRIVFTDRLDDAGLQTALFIARSDGSEVTQLTDASLNAFEPAWSPDGRQVVFTLSSLEDYDYDLYVINADGSGLRQVTSGPTADFMAAWSPDGTRIVFSRGDAFSTTVDLYAVDADGSNPQLLTNSPVDAEYAASWAPGGHRIIFERYDADTETSDLFTIGSAGERERRLTDTTWNASWPSFSPNGRWILFGSDKDGDWDIYRMRRDGSQLTKLTHNTTDERVADWQRK